MRKPILITLSAGTALTLGCTGPKVVEEGPLGNPPPPAGTFPRWEDVPSGHPEGATNPPRPVLIVTPDGECYKDWVGSMMAPQPNTIDRVQDCSLGTPETDCGTQIECPERADELLAKWRAGDTGEKKDAP